MARHKAYRKAEQKIEEAGLTGATELNLSVNWDGNDLERLTELPESLSRLTQLQSLELTGNQLSTLPDSLSQLTQLRSLKLSLNQLTTLPDSLGQLTQMQSLDLSDNRLTALPESLSQLTQLQSLDLSNNRLTAPPESLSQLTQLQSLNLSNTQLTSLPESLVQMRQLQLLDLSRNELRAIPEWLGELTQLRSLDLSNNRLTVLPQSLGQLKDLRVLALWQNSLRALPASIGQLRKLEKLLLPINQLKTIPKSIGALKSLTTLDFGHVSAHTEKSRSERKAAGNPLGTVPDCVARLYNLRSLGLDGCEVSSIPDWLSDLPNLSVLELRENNLQDLPASLHKLETLAHLSLDTNPLNPELAAAYEEGVDAVKRYLRLKAEAQAVLYEAKLILIGEGEVGKSCLLGALRGDPWDKDRTTTHGIEIKPTKVTNSSTGTEITLNAWDFGGQRVYRPTHQLFFSSPAVYLVVWKPREGPQQGFVKEWIKLVKHREPEARVLVVATHGGPRERQPDIDRQEIWDLFGKDTVIDFFHIDSKPDDKTGTCKGLEELKDAIARVAASLPEVGRSVPMRWQEVRQALKETGEAYLPLDQVLTICGEHKMSEAEAQDFVRISHRLGHLIHYGHDPRLKEMIILKPDWLATAVSFVLDDEETREKNGLVTFNRLGELWSDKQRDADFRYPSKVHPMFVALMERFDLSYRVAGSPLGGQLAETHLIAQLVPDIRPEAAIAREWPDETAEGDEQQVQTCLIVDEKGQSAPAEGLFYQLIVRLHKFSLGRRDFDASVHWQRGLILDDDYNGRALLEHAGNDVRITVRAAYPSNLLAVLTHEVKWLVENFWEGLNCRVVVPCTDPCGKNEPGTGLFEVEKLIRSKRPERPEYPCPVCNEWQNIDHLLKNAPAARRPSIELLLAEGFGDIRSRLDQLRQQGLELNQNQKRMMSQVQDAFHGLMLSMKDEGKDGPRLFSLEPVERSAFNPNGWAKKKFRVTLWCEHTRLPLPLLNKNDDEGVYEFDVTREWFAKAAPFLKALTGTLSLVLPVAASATKLALDEVTYKGLEKQLDLGKNCATAMLTAIGDTGEWLAEKKGPGAERFGTIRAHGGILREFQVWLKKEDPAFGDLRRVLNKQKEFMWVHRDYEHEY